MILQNSSAWFGVLVGISLPFSNNAAPEVETRLRLPAQVTIFSVVPIQMTLHNKGGDEFLVNTEPHPYQIRVEIRTAPDGAEIYRGPAGPQLTRLMALQERPPPVPFKPGQIRSWPLNLSCAFTNDQPQVLFQHPGRYAIRVQVPFSWREGRLGNWLYVTSSWVEFAVSTPTGADTAALEAFRNLSNAPAILAPMCIGDYWIPDPNPVGKECREFLNNYGSSLWAPYARFALAKTIEIDLEGEKQSQKTRWLEARSLLDAVTNRLDFSYLDDARILRDKVEKQFRRFAKKPPPSLPDADSGTQQEITPVVQEFFELMVSGKLSEWQKLMTEDFSRQGLFNREQTVQRVQKDFSEKLPNGGGRARTSVIKIKTLKEEVLADVNVTLQTLTTSTEQRYRLTLIRGGKNWLVRLWDTRSE